MSRLGEIVGQTDRFGVGVGPTGNWSSHAILAPAWIPLGETPAAQPFARPPQRPRVAETRVATRTTLLPRGPLRASITDLPAEVIDKAKMVQAAHVANDENSIEKAQQYLEENNISYSIDEICTCSCLMEDVAL